MTERLAAHGCITCGDEALPVRVLRVDRARSLALCSDAEGELRSVEIALVEPVALGEMLLVHAGTALGRAAEGAGLRALDAAAQEVPAVGREVPN